MSKLPLEIRWHLAERRAQRAYKNDPASGLSCGPAKVAMTGDRFWAHKGAWIFHFGAYGCTHVLAYGSLEDALEDAAAWLAENAPGHLTEPDYEATRKELALTLRGTCDLDDMNEETIAEHAEADLTYTESGWLVSYEWSVTELYEPQDLLNFVLRK